MVTDTVDVSDVSGHDINIRTSASTFANCCDFVWISTEASNVLSDPSHCRALVVEAIVCFVSSITQFFRGHETCSSKSVA
jgi:hypothetical protein